MKLRNKRFSATLMLFVLILSLALPVLNVEAQSSFTTTGLRATKDRSDGVTIRWTPTPGAIGYGVYRLQHGTNRARKIGSTGTNAYTDTSAQIGYSSYWVMPIKSVSGKYTTGTLSDNVWGFRTPIAPTNPHARANNDNSIYLTWSAVPGVDTYCIYRKALSDRGGSWEPIRYTADTYYSDTQARELGKDETYLYVIQAGINHGSKFLGGPTSSYVSAKINAASKPHTPPAPRPTYPSEPEIPDAPVLDRDKTVMVTTYEEFQKEIEAAGMHMIRNKIEKYVLAVNMNKDFKDGWDTDHSQNGQMVLRLATSNLLYRRTPGINNLPNIADVKTVKGSNQFYKTPKNPVTTYVTLEISYSTTANQDEALQNQINYVASLARNKAYGYEQIKAVYDWVVYNVRYSWSEGSLNSYGNDAHSAYAAGVDKEALCQGYASFSMMVLNQLGYQTTYVTSHADNHGWFMVNLNGQWYHVDPTYGAGNQQRMYDYFMKSSRTFQDLPGHTIYSSMPYAPEDYRP